MELSDVPVFAFLEEFTGKHAGHEPVKTWIVKI